MIATLTKKIKDNWPVLLILLAANIALFWKFYLKGLLPFPGDLLVSFFFPWNTGGFTGFDQWTTRKEVVAADVIRQMFPWQIFSFDLIRNFQLPLWNPYNFSGTPHLANLQSAVFFIGNIFSVFLPILHSWILMVVITLPLFGLFTYVFLRGLKLSRLSAAVGALAATNLSYLTIWQEQLVMVRAALFLPLTLWAIDKRRVFLVPILLALGILGGHAQTTIYVFIIAFSYALFRRRSIKLIAFWFIAPLLLSAIQLVPTAELYLYSAREGEVTRTLFWPFTLPWKNIVTAFAPDFFGNVSTNNFWGEHYPDFAVYFGVATLTLTFGAVLTSLKDPVVKFFTILGLAGLFFATWPGAVIIYYLNVPILASGVPARAVFLLQFSGAILASYGINNWPRLRTVIPVFLVYLGLWILTLVNQTPEFAVSRNNLILPSLVFALTAFAILVKNRLAILLIVAAMIFESTYQFNKYQPFAPAKFVFPSHPVLTYLSQNAGVNRFFGFGSANLDDNFATYYKIFSPSGYDSLYIKRYGELLASTENGLVPKTIPRSTAVFSNNDTVFRNRLFDILGVKYILDKNDQWRENPAPELTKFPGDRYSLAWARTKWRIYERKSTLPRVFLADGYEVISDNKEIIARIYSQTFDYRRQVILEADPHFNAEPGIGSAQIVSYEPNKVVVKTDAKVPKLLFLSDVYFPGWKAEINGLTKPIYRADYAFRVVLLSAGQHEVAFTYDPLSFKIGAVVTLVSSMGFLILWRKRKF